MAAKTINFALEASRTDSRSIRRTSLSRGPGYWEYGTSCTCVTIQVARSALGTDFGVHESAGLNTTGWYRIDTLGPFGMQFTYADGAHVAGAVPRCPACADLPRAALCRLA